MAQEETAGGGGGHGVREVQGGRNRTEGAYKESHIVFHFGTNRLSGEFSSFVFVFISFPWEDI